MSREGNQSAAIRTPDQRLRVFVSSTLAELAEERTAVARAITALRLTPVLFELGARPHPPQELYRAYLAQSDIFIGIYWQRYGWVGPGMEISGLEDEFQLSQNMPRLLYMKTPAPNREARLTAMISRLQTDATNSYRAFQSPRELGRLVREDLAVLLSERFAGYRETNAPAGNDSSRLARKIRSLPSQPTSLVGRQQDIVQVVELLESPAVRLVTLTGPGGIGKTRLAVAVAEHLQHRYPTAPAVFVPLTTIAEPDLVFPRIAEALGASLEGTGRPLDALVEHLGDMDALLILDNLEQVVGVGPDLTELLNRCPGLKIVATSRTVLRLRAEHEYPVGALTVPTFPEPPTLDQVMTLPAVELFVDRARAVRRDFALSKDNAAVVAEICRRLDGLPLGIELAAARVRLLEPTALLARLGPHLEALGKGPADLPERQRTLRATIEWSIGLLNDRERDMLATLCVFADGWTIDAAVRVAGIEEDRTLDLLDSLAGHSLVNIASGEYGPRFRMLETIRELASELLTPVSGLPVLAQRHASYFREFVESMEWPLPDETEWAERLQTEEGNLRLAIRWFFANDITALPHTFRLLWRFWLLRDRIPEGRAWIEELLPRATMLDDQGRAELWLTSAMTALEVGDDESALTAAREISRLLNNIEDLDLKSAMQMALSWALPITSGFDEALAAASHSLQGFRQLDEPFMAANAVFTLGMLEMAVGHYDVARRHLSEVHASENRLGNNWLTTVSCVQLASLAVESGQLGEARALLNKSLQKSVDMERSTLMVTFCLVTYARLALGKSEPQQAALALGAVDGLRDRSGQRSWPLSRSGEALLLSRVKELMPQDEFQDAFADGSQLSRQDAIAIMQGEAST